VILCIHVLFQPIFATIFFNLATMVSFIFASQGLRFGSPFSPPLADLEYILMIHALIFHWLQLPVHVSNQNGKDVFIETKMGSGSFAYI
jgi:hypothetical protein